MNPLQHTPQPADFFQTRRQFLNRFGMGVGALSLGSLVAPKTDAGVSLSPLAPRQPHYLGRAKRVIHIFAQGGPTHLDTWDYKPSLTKYAGQTVEEIGGVPLPPPNSSSPNRASRASKSVKSSRRSAR